MKKVWCIVSLFSVSIFFVFLGLSVKEETREYDYFDTQRKGANFMNRRPIENRFKEAANNNIKLIRMTFGKWQGEKDCFLMGDASNYTGIVQSDLEFLITILDFAHIHEISVILLPLDLPGAVWTQNNNGKIDGRLWKDRRYQNMAIKYWQDIAMALKGHPAIVGYNIINEPLPEKFYGKSTHWIGSFNTWYEGVKGRAGDLNLFYAKVIRAIRKVDKETTIILDSGLYATPWAFDYLEKQEDKNIIYSFHMYEPYDYTTQRINKGKFTYPGNIFINDLEHEYYVDYDYLENFLNRVNTWANNNNIASNRIMVGEFGISREVSGSENYMQDLITIFNKNGWHWLFYSFQEDDWHAWDYQFGSEKVYYKYWEYVKNNTLEENRDKLYDKVSEAPIWDLLMQEFSMFNHE